MADNNIPEHNKNASIWPAVTVLLVLLTIGLGAWDFTLQNKNKTLQDEVKHLKSRVEAMEAHDRTVDAKVTALAAPPAASSSRRRRAAAAAAATAPTTTTAPAAVTAPAVTK